MDADGDAVGDVTGGAGTAEALNTADAAKAAESADVAKTAESAGTEHSSGMPSALSVSGTQLVDASGNPVQLRGISTHGIAWYPQYVNEECFRQLRDEWGMNVVRLAMYTAESGGYCTDGNQENLKELVKSGVQYATDCGMYAIIDWHILSDGNPGTNLEAAKAFFGEMAELYADYTNVIYEICNEPNGGTSWSDVKKYAEQVIGVIREKDADGIILVGTPNWCQYVDQAAADPITGYENLMYTLHFYAATHTEALRETFVRAVEDGLPVFVSEFGICDASGNGAIDTYQADQWVEILNEYGVSYMAWNLSNKAETSAVLKSSCGKVSGFALEDLSDSGKWLYEKLGDENLGGGNAVGEDAGAGSAGTAAGRAAGVRNVGNGTDRNVSGEVAGTGTAGTVAGGAVGSGTAGNQQFLPGTNVGGSAESTAISDGLEITAKVVNSWTQNDGTYFQYEVKLSNPGDVARSNWKIQLTFSCDIALQDGWNGNYETEGNTLTISSMDYNGSMEKGGCVENIGFILRAEEDCELEQ